MLLDAAVIEAGRRNLYALATAKDAIQTFERHPKFEALGPLSQVLQTRKDAVPDALQSYDTTTRDPQVFVKRNIQ